MTLRSSAPAVRPVSRRSLLKGTAAAALGLGLASVLPAGLETQVARATESSGDGTFTMAISYMPTSLQPSSGGNDDQTIVVRPVYECLFQELAGDEIEYHLADSLEISEDGLTYTVHIREDANWSDGEPVVVDDIMLALAYGGRNSDGVTTSTYVNDEPVTFNQIDEKTLEVVLPSVYVTYIYTMCNWYPLPSHIFSDYTEVVDQASWFFTTDMVTNGAFTVEEINEDSIVYAPRDDYYAGELSIRRLVARTIGSGSTRQVAFENGEISYMRITSSEELERYSSDESTYTVYSVSESRLNYLQLNMNGPVMSTLGEDARRAIMLALNSQEIIDFAYGTDELATPANSPLTPDQYDYDPDCAGYTQDVELAAELAQSSGLAGQTLTYIYNADRSNMEQVAVVIQQELAAIGVNLSIEGLDSTTFFNRFFYGTYGTDQGNTWDLGTNGWDSERGISGRQAYTYIVQGSTGMTTGFSDDIADLARQANTTADQDERYELWKQIQERYFEEYWEYPLTYTNYVMVSHKDVSGLDASPIVPEFSQYAAIQMA